MKTILITAGKYITIVTPTKQAVRRNCLRRPLHDSAVGLRLSTGARRQVVRCDMTDDRRTQHSARNPDFAGVACDHTHLIPTVRRPRKVKISTEIEIAVFYHLALIRAVHAMG